EFVAVRCKTAQQGSIHHFVSEALPAIGDDMEATITLAAAQVQHQTRTANALDQLLEPLIIDAASGEYPGRDDDVARTRIQPARGIPDVHAPAVLHPPRPGPESGARGLYIARPQGNDVPAIKPVLTVQGGKTGRAFGSDKIGLEALLIAVAEGAADNLYHLAVMQVDAGSELHGGISAEKIRGKHTQPPPPLPASVKLWHTDTQLLSTSPEPAFQGMLPASKEGTRRQAKVRQPRARPGLCLTSPRL